MGFVDAVKSGFQNCFDFSGRAARSEYWYFTLFYALWSLIGDGARYAVDDFHLIGGLRAGMIGCYFVLLLLPVIPHLAVATRRLHDTNHSGWWVVAFSVIAAATQFLPDMSSSFVLLAKIGAYLRAVEFIMGLILLIWLVDRGTEAQTVSAHPNQ